MNTFYVQISGDTYITVGTHKHSLGLVGILGVRFVGLVLPFLLGRLTIKTRLMITIDVSLLLLQLPALLLLHRVLAVRGESGLRLDLVQAGLQIVDIVLDGHTASTIDMNIAIGGLTGLVLLLMLLRHPTPQVLRWCWHGDVAHVMVTPEIVLSMVTMLAVLVERRYQRSVEASIELSWCSWWWSVLIMVGARN